MAWYDDRWGEWQDPDYFDGGPSASEHTYELLFGRSYEVDDRAQELFREAFFENDDRAYIDLIDYMWDRYQIDFEDAFEWQDFREWYDSQ